MPAHLPGVAEAIEAHVGTVACPPHHIVRRREVQPTECQAVRNTSACRLHRSLYAPCLRLQLCAADTAAGIRDVLQRWACR